MLWVGKVGLGLVCARGGARSLLAGMVVGGGRHDIVVPVRGSVPMATNMASCELAWVRAWGLLARNSHGVMYASVHRNSPGTQVWVPPTVEAPTQTR